jgi:DNA topoisomerase-3
MITIITDNRSIAREIARSLNIDTENQRKGYRQNRDYAIISTDGELVCLASAAEYGKKHFAPDDLPFIPKSFIFSVCKRKNAKGVLSDRAAREQLKTVKNLFDASQSIIVATEPSEKGELTFRRIYHYLQCEKPFKRLWLSCLTKKAILEGLQNLQEGSLYDNLYAAADCREKADFLINTNADLAFSIATAMAHYSPEQLQTATLALICKRATEHRKAASSRFYEQRTTLEKEGQTRQFRLTGSIKNRQKALKIYEQLKTFKEARITKTELQIGIQPPPLLYNLTELQKDANICYGFPAAKTAKIARKLYEEMLISFPVTDSRQIPETIFDDMPKIVRQAAVYCDLTDFLNTAKQHGLNRHSVGNTAAIGHHAIIPTDVFPAYLPKDDKLVYTLIATRTIESFAPNCQKKITHIEAVCGDIVLESKVAQVLRLGWRSILNREEDREEHEAKQGETVPLFATGERVRIASWNLLTKKVLPKPLYTEATLLSAMEEAWLGVPETRAEIIESLFYRGYTELWEQSLMPSKKGIALYNRLKKMHIADMKLIKNREKALKNIALGKQSAEKFMAALEDFTQKATDEILKSR